MTHYRSTALSIIASDPLFYNTRTFSERLTSQINSYSHEVRAIGGYASASLSIGDKQRKIEDWIEYGLGRHITVYSPSLVVIWEGFVNQISATLGPFQFTVGPLLDIKNRVYGSYSAIDTSVTPPTIGTEATVTTVNNTTSQDRFGIIEDAFSLNEATNTEASQLLNMIINDPNRAYPPTSRDSNLSGDNGPSVQIDCLGYWNWLKAYSYSNTAGTGNINLSAKIQDVLGASPNSLFSTDYTMIASNTTQVKDYEDGTRKAEAILIDMNPLGDSSYNAYTMGFYAGRRFIYQPIPTEIAYQQRIAGSRGIVNPLDAIIRPWTVLGARYIFYPDFLIGRHPPASGTALGQDPRSGFIETVSFSLPYQVSINGMKLSTLETVLARRGLGAIS